MFRIVKRQPGFSGCRQTALNRQSWSAIQRRDQNLPKANLSNQSESQQKQNQKQDVFIQQQDFSGNQGNQPNEFNQADKDNQQKPDKDGDGQKKFLVRLIINSFQLAQALMMFFALQLKYFFQKGGLILLALPFVASWYKQNGGISKASSAKRAVPQMVHYSDYYRLVTSGRVECASFSGSQQSVTFNLKPTAKEVRLQRSEAQKNAQNLRTLGTSQVRDYLQRQTRQARPSEYKTDLVTGKAHAVQLLLENGGTIAAVDPISEALMAGVRGMLAIWLPMLPMIYIVYRMMKSRLPDSRNSKGKAVTAPNVTFEDVAGVDVARRELMELVHFLKQPDAYKRMNARLPAGVLLTGPPGTGKTLLAKAVAGQAGVRFFAMSASEFVELYVGRGAARVRELFAEARRAAPSVVFIDELDAIGSNRGAGHNEERDQTLNQLLTELDGFSSRHGVLLVSATNRPNVLDPALMRPGRLSRRIEVPLPDEHGRKQILAVHLRRVPVRNDEEKMQMCDALAKMTPGMSGAGLANAVNEAAIVAVRRQGDGVTLEDLLEGFRRTKYSINGRGDGKWLQGLDGITGWLKGQSTPGADAGDNGTGGSGPNGNQPKYRFVS